MVMVVIMMMMIIILITIMVKTMMIMMTPAMYDDRAGAASVRLVHLPDQILSSIFSSSRSSKKITHQMKFNISNLPTRANH